MDKKNNYIIFILAVFSFLFCIFPVSFAIHKEIIFFQIFSFGIIMLLIYLIKKYNRKLNIHFNNKQYIYYCCFKYYY